METSIRVLLKGRANWITIPGDQYRATPTGIDVYLGAKPCAHFPIAEVQGVVTVPTDDKTLVKAE